MLFRSKAKTSCCRKKKVQQDKNLTIRLLLNKKQIDNDNDKSWLDEAADRKRKIKRNSSLLWLEKIIFGDAI